MVRKANGFGSPPRIHRGAYEEAEGHMRLAQSDVSTALEKKDCGKALEAFGRAQWWHGVAMSSVGGAGATVSDKDRVKLLNREDELTGSRFAIQRACIRPMKSGGASKAPARRKKR